MDWSSQWTCLLPVSQWFKLIWDLFSLHRLLKSNCFITQHDDSQHVRLQTPDRPHTPVYSHMADLWPLWGLQVERLQTSQKTGSDVCGGFRSLLVKTSSCAKMNRWRVKRFLLGQWRIVGQLGSLGMMGRILCCRCCCGISGGRGHQLGGSWCFSYLAGPSHMGGTMRPAIAERRPDKDVHISSTEINSSMC